MLLDHSKVRGLDSQTSIREGQTTDLVLELLTHVSVLICEPSQAKPKFSYPTTPHASPSELQQNKKPSYYRTN